MQAAVIKGTGSYGDPVQVNIDDPLTKGSFALFPNPTVDILNIALSKEYRHKVELISLNGILIKEWYFESSRYNSLSIDDINSGLYFVKVIAENGEYSIKKVTIER